MKPLFPKWMNTLPTVAFAVVNGGVILVVAGMWYYATPKFWEVGYMPVQPDSGFNHQIHAGKLGMDCRYCHSHVEESWHSNVPSTQTCYGCHSEGKLGPEASATDEKVQFIRDSYESGEPIRWRRVHKLPDYAHFPHNVHVAAGVSCYSCHGQIAGMPVVAQAESLSMGWCLDCHRAPEEHLVPTDRVTDLYWVEHEWMATPVADRSIEGVTPEQLLDSLYRNPPEHCAACHF
ncbi:MAG: cytochrome c3 family protein [Planctomycetota bacterium]